MNKESKLLNLGGAVVLKNSEELPQAIIEKANLIGIQI
jgi:hypothetical protein